MKRYRKLCCAYVLRSNYRVSNENEKRAKEGEEEGGDTMTRFCASCGGIGILAFDDNRRLLEGISHIREFTI